jgi:hypothetical protein
MISPLVENHSRKSITTPAKNVCPVIDYAEAASSMFAHLAFPSVWVLITLEVSIPAKHDPAAHSVPSHRSTLHSQRLFVLLLRHSHLLRYAKSETGNSLPIKSDSDNAI